MAKQLPQSLLNSLKEKKSPLSIDNIFPINSIQLSLDHCHWLFKGLECSYDGPAEACDKTFTRCQELSNTSNYSCYAYRSRTSVNSPTNTLPVEDLDNRLSTIKKKKPKDKYFKNYKQPKRKLDI